MQTKTNARPDHCTHSLYPLCKCTAHLNVTEACVEPITKPDLSVIPRADLSVVYEHDKKKAQAKAKKKPGRPKQPFRSEHDDFIARLPMIMEDPQTLKELEQLLLAEECRRSLAKFAQEAWKIVEPATEFEWNWHHQLLCDVLQGVFEEWEKAKDDRKFKMRLNNLLVNIPPGTSKSRLLACFFPVWVWLRRPGVRFLCISLNETASIRDARDAMFLIQDDWFQDLFQPDWTITENQEAISNYGNTKGGVRLSRALGSKIIGLRADILLADDLNDPTEVGSKVKRDAVNNIWKDTLYNRVNNVEQSLRIGIQQRTHEEDWSGYVLKAEGIWDPVTNPGGWLHVCLPAEYDPQRKCKTPWGEDPRTEKGQSLHWNPETKTGRLSPEFLQKERLRLGSSKYSGLMDQRPTAAEGGMVKLAWWRFFQYEDRPIVSERKDRCPDNVEMDTAYPTLVVKKTSGWSPTWDFDWTIISVDAAAKHTERGSQHGILVVSGKGPRRFVRDDRTFRGDFLEVIKVVKELCAKYDPDKILIEDKAMGSDLATMFRAQIVNGDVKGSNGKYLRVVVDTYNPGSSSKESRLDACLPELEAGLVFLPEKASWIEPFVGEISAFPLGSQDDRTDSLSMALNFTREMGSYVLPKWS